MRPKASAALQASGPAMGKVNGGVFIEGLAWELRRKALVAVPSPSTLPARGRSGSGGFGSAPPPPSPCPAPPPGAGHPQGEGLGLLWPWAHTQNPEGRASRDFPRR